MTATAAAPDTSALEIPMGLSYAVGYWWLAWWGFHTRNLAFEIVAVYVITVICVAVCAHYRSSWSEGLFWRTSGGSALSSAEKLSHLRKGIYVAIISVAMLTATIAVWSMMMTLHGPFGATPAIAQSLWNYTETYLWNLIDAIPILKITDILGWHPPLTFGNTCSEICVIVFRLLVVVPALNVVIRLVQWGRV